MFQSKMLTVVKRTSLTLIFLSLFACGGGEEPVEPTPVVPPPVEEPVEPTPIVPPPVEEPSPPIATPIVPPVVRPPVEEPVEPTPIVPPPVEEPSPPIATPIVPPKITTVLERDTWVLSASSNEEELALAIDGDRETRWTTRQNQSDSDWLEIDLGESASFNRILLDSDRSPEDYPRSFGVFVSDDGLDWGEAIASGNGDEPTIQIDLPDVSTRFLRIEQNGTSDTQWWSIHEVNIIYSNDTNPVPPVVEPVPPIAVPVPPVENPVAPAPPEPIPPVENPVAPAPPEPIPPVVTPEPVEFPRNPFSDNPESVVIENNVGWVEGPTWVPDEKGFIYNLTDRDSADIHRIWRPGQDGTSEYWRVPGSNHGAIWSEGLIFLTNREPGRIGYIDPSQDPLEETVIRDGLGRPNDLDRFSDGSIYFSDWPNGGVDGVYRLEMNGDLEQVISPDEIDNPNGIAFTADCKRLYVANTGESVIAYDVDDDGNLSNRRVHASGLGSVNGIAVDVAGNLYVPNGDGVRVFNSEGERVGDWNGPQAVVNLTFGGEDHKWLLTTNKNGVTAVRTEIPGGECNGLVLQPTSSD